MEIGELNLNLFQSQTEVGRVHFVTCVHSKTSPSIFKPDFHRFGFFLLFLCFCEIE